MKARQALEGLKHGSAMSQPWWGHHKRNVPLALFLQEG